MAIWEGAISMTFYCYKAPFSRQWPLQYIKGVARAPVKEIQKTNNFILTIEILSEFIFTINKPRIMFTIIPKDVIFPQNLRHRCRGDNSPSCYDFKRSDITGRGDRFFNEFLSHSRLQFYKQIDFIRQGKKKSLKNYCPLPVISDLLKS